MRPNRSLGVTPPHPTSARTPYPYSQLVSDPNPNPNPSDVTKENSKRKLPIGDTMSEEAKFKVKSRTASGKEKFIADPENEKRDIPEKMMACKGCE